MRDDFAVFILSHGRADRIYTLKSLQQGNYSGKWYIVIDNEDGTEKEYRKRFGEYVLQFDKLAVSQTFDTADLSEDRRTIVYARNACFDLAKQVGVKYFCELDDDYVSFMFRELTEKGYEGIISKNLDVIFSAFVDFLEVSGALSVAFAQGGDFIGGAKGRGAKQAVLRKCMNSFFCSVERPFKFLGRINEDVNTYTTLASRGGLFMTITDFMLTQKTTQSNKGGMTDVYLDKGTFLKTFYTVMMMPSAVKVAMISSGKNARIHHHVSWNNTAPCVLAETYRKKGADEK